MARYIPGNVSDLATKAELDKISQAMETADVMLNLEKVYAVPKKFREGSIVFADGTTWNPGSGGGIYCYRAGAWRFLG